MKNKRILTLLMIVLTLVVANLITITAFAEWTLPELNDGKDKDIELIRIEAKNSTNKGFTVEFTVNDGAVNKNTSITYAHTIFENLVIKSYNIGYSSVIPTTKTVPLNSLTKISSSGNNNVYSVFIEEVMLGMPQTLYVYAMLKTQDGETEVEGCQLKIDRTTTYSVINPNPSPVYTQIPVTPIPTSQPTLISTPEPTYPALTPIPTTEPSATATPTTVPTFTPEPLPTPTAATTALAVSLSLTGAHTLVLDDSGGLWAWGWNELGQLGDETKTNSKIPIKIMDGVKDICAGSEVSFAIKENGELWSWGWDTYGVLGKRNGVASNIPAKIMDNVKSVSCHSEHALAVLENGELWAWGRNDSGQLGNGAYTGGSTPVKVMDNVIFASAGTYHSLAIKDNGELWAWGNNTFGELGDGSNTNRRTPIKVMDDVAYVSADSYTLAVKSNGELWAWGNNQMGTLADGSKTNSNKPKHVMDNVKLVSACIYHAFAVKVSGELYGWGWNGYGQIGNGRTDGFDTGLGGGWGDSEIKITSPTKIMDNVKLACAGYNHSSAVTDNGRIWSWGENRIGQFGNGTTSSGSLVPIQIPFPQ